jgi:hypothetical protein
MAKSTSVDIEFFELVAKRTDSVSQAKMAQAFVLELLENPEGSHKALEFGFNSMANTDQNSLLSLSDLPEEAYKEFKNAFEAWAVIANSAIEQIDDTTRVLCQKVANLHIKKLEDLGIDCIDTRGHAETVVFAVTTQIVTIMLHEVWDEYLTNFFSTPWFSSEGMRTVLADLSPVWKLYYPAEDE